MNIKKGLDRIALIIAILCIFPAFLIGAQQYKELREIEVKISPPKLWSNESNIKSETLLEWKITSPPKGWSAYPHWSAMYSGEIVRNKKTGSCWIWKGEKWEQIKIDLKAKEEYKAQKTKFPFSPPYEGLIRRHKISGELKIFYADDWRELTDVEIDDESKIGNKEVSAVSFISAVTFTPPFSHVLVAGFVSAIGVFLFVLFIIKGAIRLAGWIGAGFK